MAVSRRSVTRRKSQHLNAFGVTHGGALRALLDVAMATAARSVQKDVGLVTIEMKTSFMQTARGKVMAKGRLIHRSAHMAFTEATVFDDAGRSCAHATGTFKYTQTLAQRLDRLHGGRCRAAAQGTDPMTASEP